ncbi:hypothetical protein CKM354_000199100 [Cercospora kikuchii]|uniref:J domain-containing protein n=1 Tax=Cercospora kikuchii TaxID=84275 RepID=A0A9P3CH92_9PEZI|nr:uncharacterized protein CKM354_000199100 [Cercospora kikuchii]GIZ38578.1 hypothetical protein CKM354_000199100 [Cercospora kikuchii]
MPTTAALQAAGLNVCELRQIIKLDREATKELQSRTDKLRRDLRNGGVLPEKTVEMMEDLNKDMTRELVQKIEKIESQDALTTTDRELLQALNAQLAKCDQSGMKLAELRDLEEELQRRRRDSGYKDTLPLGGTPRRISKASARYTPAEIPHTIPIRPNVNLPPPPPYTPTYSPSSSDPTLTPPSSRSPRSSNHSLERVDSSQGRSRKSMERARPAVFMPPIASTSPRFPPPPTSPIMPASAPMSSTPPTPPTPRSFRSMPSPFAPAVHPPFAAPPEPVRRSSSNKRASASGTGEYQFYSYADYDDSDDEAIHAEWSKTDWPLLYRILDINPSTDPDVLLLLAKRQLERLSLRHNPNRNPEDPDAPARWIAINKAYDVLTHPERKRYYDEYGREPDEVEGIDLTGLKIS